MHPAHPQFVGIDVGKHELAVAIQPTGTHFTLPNTVRGHRQLLQRLGAAPACIVLEATGRYHRVLQLALAGADRPAAVIDPARVHGFRISEGIRAKTDGLDADLLARYAAQKQPAPSPLPSPTRTALADWVRSRDFLVSQRQALVNRRAEMPPALQRGHGQLIRSYDRQIAAADQEIARQTRPVRQPRRDAADLGVRDRPRDGGGPARAAARTRHRLGQGDCLAGRGRAAR